MARTIVSAPIQSETRWHNVREHRAILDAIRAGDAEGAALHMRMTLEKSHIHRSGAA